MCVYLHYLIKLLTPDNSKDIEDKYRRTSNVCTISIIGRISYFGLMWIGIIIYSTYWGVLWNNAIDKKSLENLDIIMSATLGLFGMILGILCSRVAF
jgi:hypothetical protein